MDAEDGPVCLEDPAAFYTMLRTEKGRLYGLHIADLWPTPSVQLHATIPDPGIPPEYADLARVFSEDEASDLPDHGPQDLTIDLYEGKQPPWGPIYNLSAKELDVLREYLGKHLKRG
jgi:hypothetical protein